VSAKMAHQLSASAPNSFGPSRVAPLPTAVRDHQRVTRTLKRVDVSPM